VGFYDRDQDALAHLRNVCVLPHMSEAGLLEEWAAARARLGAPMPGAGAPEIRELGSAEAAYAEELCARPWVQALLQKPDYRAASFKLVEIAPLLAHQPFVDLERSDRSCESLREAGIAELMQRCLPPTQPRPFEPPTVVDRQPHSIIIKLPRPHVEQLKGALMRADDNGVEQTIAGVALSYTLPFVQVVRLEGRYYLQNGYHRTFGAARLGVTHIPCLVRNLSNGNDAQNHAEAPDWMLMPRRLLESSNPPTLGHFLRGRAHDVMLRAWSLNIHITWSHAVMADEYEGLKP